MQPQTEAVGKDALEIIYQDGKDKITQLAIYQRYPVEEIESRIWNKLAPILSATSIVEARYLVERAFQAFFVHVLSAKAAGRITGPITAETFEKKAKQADSLAKFQENLGHGEAADKQKKRAEDLRKEAMKLRKNPNKKVKLELILTKGRHPEHPTRKERSLANKEKHRLLREQESRLRETRKRKKT